MFLLSWGFALQLAVRVKYSKFASCNVGHSRSRARASYPSCVAAYPAAPAHVCSMFGFSALGLATVVRVLCLIIEQTSV
jgi:hypothetical protein